MSALLRGFPERPRTHFERAFRRLAEHPTPAGYPKYGYLLEADGETVGVLLIIFAAIGEPGAVRIRGNVANWYVDQDFRAYAPLLTSHALAHKGVTFLNITPAQHTWRILEAQGYKRFASGGFFAIAALNRPRLGAHVRSFDRAKPAIGLTDAERELLTAHQGYGCICLLCDDHDGAHPFVFIAQSMRWKRMPLRYASLVYCRSIDEFIRFAGPLGRFLARRGMPLVYLDANGDVPELTGKYVDWGPKFYRGPDAPRLGDIAFTERVVFNL